MTGWRAQGDPLYDQIERDYATGDEAAAERKWFPSEPSRTPKCALTVGGVLIDLGDEPVAPRRSPLADMKPSDPARASRLLEVMDSAIARSLAAREEEQAIQDQINTSTE